MKASTSPRDTAEAIHSLAIHLLRHVQVEDDASGLGGAPLSALSVLVFGGPHTLGELAAAERVSLPTMTRIAAALMRRGYTRREHVEHDRRFIRLFATERGVRLLHEGRERRVTRLLAMLEGLSPADLDACSRAADVLAAALTRAS